MPVRRATAVRAAPALAGAGGAIPWAELLRKVFAVDVLECPRCVGRIELIAFIAEPAVVRRILDHLGLDSRAPPLAKASPFGDEGSGDDPAPDYTAADPTYDD